ncbi:MAG: hypothetical protein IVW56_02905 [Candidatus Binataceae bacterium]|nr:hypothetical protein [Candidatus Binataceae bacterium]
MRMIDTDTRYSEFAEPTDDARMVPLAGRQCARRRLPKVRIGAWALAAMIAGCATAQAPAKPPPLSPSASAAPARGPNDGHIYVSSESLPGECYHDLGPVTYTEPFFESVIDPDDKQLNEHLRALARQQYPAGLDAVVDVQKIQNLAGTEVAITGRAVTMSNRMTVECALRATPGVVDSASRVIAGGILGTAVGGLVGSTTGAEAGGAIGVVGTGAIEAINHTKAVEEAQTELNNRIAAQQTQITQLRTQLAKLVTAQCDDEELSAAACTRRVTEIEHSTMGTAVPVAGAITAVSASADAPIISKFDVNNQLQAQQEMIERMQSQIATMKHQADTR